MTPKEVDSLLEKHGLRPVRDRGQNFLLDEDMVTRIVDESGVGEGDRVLEIGPGFGVLTGELLERGARVLAVELDPALAGVLRDRFGSDRLDILQADIRDTDNSVLAERLGVGHREYRLVSNLPYAVTSDVLTRFTSSVPRPLSLTLMLQREVVDRVTAEPPDMSLLAVAVRAYGQARRVAVVPRSSFHPQPKVDSAVLHVSLFDDSELSTFHSGLEPEQVISVARTAFAAKRKKAANTLARKYPKPLILKAFSSVGVSPDARPETLTVEDWVAIAKILVG